jgi:hypothetical protein
MQSPLPLLPYLMLELAMQITLVKRTPQPLLSLQQRSLPQRWLRDVARRMHGLSIALIQMITSQPTKLLVDIYKRRAPFAILETSPQFLPGAV